MEYSIYVNQDLKMKNVLTLRRKMDQQTSVSVSKEIDEIVERSKAKKNGCTVTVTHNITVENGQQVLDLEIMIPLDKEIAVPAGFEFKNEFSINNALMVRINGNPNQMQGALKELSEYIKEKNLKPNTPLYVVTVKEAKIPAEVNDMVTEIYIGV